MDALSIAGTYSDYYEVKYLEGSEPEYKALRKPIRTLVERYCECLNESIAQGKNPHLVTLDLSDEISKFMEPAPIEAQASFYVVYAEEMNAAAATINDKTAKLNAQNAKSNESAALAGQWIAAIIVFCLVVAFLINM